jgi:hypothetical protein
MMSPPPCPDPAALLERLKELTGQWSGVRPDGREVGVSYRSTALGSALVETWQLGPGIEALTVYHCDGADLMVTHFCPLGNQPRLRLSRCDGDRFHFEYQDASGLTPGAAHQQSFWLRLIAPDAFEREETYGGGDEPDEREYIYYRRIAA